MAHGAIMFLSPYLGESIMDLLVRRQDRSEDFGEEALEEILAIERQAQGIVRDAEAEAARIVEKAQHQAQEMKEKAEAEAKAHAQEIIQQGLTQIEEETKAIQQEAERTAQRWVQVAESHFQDALNFVLRVVTLSDMD